MVCVYSTNFELQGMSCAGGVLSHTKSKLALYSLKFCPEKPLGPGCSSNQCNFTGRTSSQHFVNISLNIPLTKLVPHMLKKKNKEKDNTFRVQTHIFTGLAVERVTNGTVGDGVMRHCLKAAVLQEDQVGEDVFHCCHVNGHLPRAYLAEGVHQEGTHTVHLLLRDTVEYKVTSGHRVFKATVVDLWRGILIVLGDSLW